MAQTSSTIRRGRPNAGFELTGASSSARVLLRGVWEHRRLILILARKDFFVRYRRATFGLLWAAALPVLQAAVLAFVVSRFANFDTDSNYTLYVLSGTVGWSAFSGAISAGSTAIVDGSALSTKIYFPRLVFPLVTVVTSAYSLGIGLVVLLLASVVSGEGIGPQAFYLLPAMAATMLLSAGFCLVLSALHVYFRDIRYLVQAALLVWLYVTPVIYPLEAIGGARGFVEANPVTGVVELYRAATVGADPGWEITLAWTAGWCGLLITAGLLLHRRFDRLFSDLL